MADEEHETAAEWAAGKSPWWRALALAWVALAAWRMIRHDPVAMMEGPGAGFVAILSALDYHVHEFGHLAFSAFPLFWTVAGGTLVQVFLPALAGVLLWRTQRDWFALSFCGAWTALGLASAAIYCADARALELDLAGLGDGSNDDGPYTGHDWNYMLGVLGILKHDLRIAGIMRLVASLILALSVFNALRLFWLMRTAKPAAA
jgi:hypothetical protein